MNLIVYKVVISPLLVALATLAGRRWGNVATGLVAGLPIVAGPVLFFYALEQGPAFASQAAVATLLGMVSLCAFLLIYAWRSWSGGTILSSLLMGWAGFAVVTLLINRVLQDHSVSLLKALVYALAALYLGRRSLPPVEEAAPALAPPLSPDPLAKGSPIAADAASRPGPWDLPLRMAAAAIMVLVLTALAQRLGPRLGGLLTPFPVASTVLAVFAHSQGGSAAARSVLKGLFLAFNSFAVFCAVLGAALTAGGLGLGVAVIVAVLAAGLTQAFVLRRSFIDPAH